MAQSCPIGMHTQSIVLSKGRFSASSARSWLSAHGFKTTLDETENSYRARQESPSRFRFFRTKSIAPGVSLVVGCPKMRRNPAYEVIPDPNANIVGTFRVGEIRTTLAKLSKLFGAPMRGDGDKTHFEWILRDSSTGDVWTIYDYRQSSKPKRDQVISWSVGGRHKGFQALQAMFAGKNPISSDSSKLIVAMIAGAAAALLGGGIAFAMTKPKPFVPLPPPSAGQRGTIQQNGIYTMNVGAQPTMQASDISNALTVAGWSVGSQVTFQQQQSAGGGPINIFVVQVTWTKPDVVLAPNQDITTIAGPNLLVGGLSGPGLPTGGIGLGF